MLSGMFCFDDYAMTTNRYQNMKETQNKNKSLTKKFLIRATKLAIKHK